MFILYSRGLSYLLIGGGIEFLNSLESVSISFPTLLSPLSKGLNFLICFSTSLDAFDNPLLSMLRKFETHIISIANTLETLLIISIAFSPELTPWLAWSSIPAETLAGYDEAGCRRTEFALLSDTARYSVSISPDSRPGLLAK